MRSMRYTVTTYCLLWNGTADAYSDGDIVSLGSRDKYWFHASDDDTVADMYTAELYIFRFNDGRSSQVEHQQYTLRCFELGGCDDSSGVDVYLETGDIILGIGSTKVSDEVQSSGSGCSPCLWLLRPIFNRSPGTVQNPTNYRSCVGGD